jgi:hypothetical protein
VEVEECSKNFKLIGLITSANYGCLKHVENINKQHWFLPDYEDREQSSAKVSVAVGSLDPGSDEATGVPVQAVPNKF